MKRWFWHSLILILFFTHFLFWQQLDVDTLLNLTQFWFWHLIFYFILPNFLFWLTIKFDTLWLLTHFWCWHTLVFFDTVLISPHFLFWNFQNCFYWAPFRVLFSWLFDFLKFIFLKFRFFFTFWEGQFWVVWNFQKCFILFLGSS